MGTVKAFEPPHTGTNYLLREFVHIVGRKHAAKLRVIALILMIGTPTLFLSLPLLRRNMLLDYITENDSRSTKTLHAAADLAAVKAPASELFIDPAAWA